MNEPTFSVIMPVYNRADTVLRACRSVLDQTVDSLELIVVDDGSTDGSADLVATLDDPRVRIIRFDTNRGANVARNRGAREARGQILSFLDSDDLYLPNKLEVVAQTLAERPEAEVLLDSFRSIDRPDGGEKECRNPPVNDNDEVLKLLFTRRLWKATPSISVKRDAAFRVGLFDEGLRRRQDFDFLARLALTANIVSIPTITWLKAYSPDAITRDLENFLSDLIAFRERHPRVYDDPELRPGFAADITRHYAKLLSRGRLRLLRRDVGRIKRHIGWTGLVSSIVTGAGELRRLSRYRRTLSTAGTRAEWSHAGLRRTDVQARRARLR